MFCFVCLIVCLFVCLLVEEQLICLFMELGACVFVCLLSGLFMETKLLAEWCCLFARVVG